MCVIIACSAWAASAAGGAKRGGVRLSLIFLEGCHAMNICNNLSALETGESVVQGSESLITARVAIKEHVWRKFRKLCTHLQIFFLSSFIFYLAVEIG